MNITRSKYDSKTAITFLMVGLGVGALLSLFVHPSREKQIPTGKDLSRNAGVDRMSA